MQSIPSTLQRLSSSMGPNLMVHVWLGSSGSRHFRSPNSATKGLLRVTVSQLKLSDDFLSQPVTKKLVPSMRILMNEVVFIRCGLLLPLDERKRMIRWVRLGFFNTYTTIG